MIRATAAALWAQAAFLRANPVVLILLTLERLSPDQGVCSALTHGLRCGHRGVKMEDSVPQGAEGRRQGRPDADPLAPTGLCAGADRASGPHHRGHGARHQPVPRPAQLRAGRPGDAPRTVHRPDRRRRPGPRPGAGHHRADGARAGAGRRGADPYRDRGAVHRRDGHPRSALVPHPHRRDRAACLHRSEPDPRRAAGAPDRHRHTGAVGPRQGAAARRPRPDRRRGVGRYRLRERPRAAVRHHPRTAALRGRRTGRRCAGRGRALPAAAAPYARCGVRRHLRAARRARGDAARHP